MYLRISFCHETFVNSSALLVSLMALRLRYGTPFGLVFFHVLHFNFQYVSNMYDLDLTFGLAIVILSLKIISGLNSKTVR